MLCTYSLWVVPKNCKCKNPPFFFLTISFNLLLFIKTVLIKFTSVKYKWTTCFWTTRSRLVFMFCFLYTFLNTAIECTKSEISITKHQSNKYATFYPALQTFFYLPNLMLWPKFISRTKLVFFLSIIKYWHILFLILNCTSNKICA